MNVPAPAACHPAWAVAGAGSTAAATTRVAAALSACHPRRMDQNAKGAPWRRNGRRAAGACPLEELPGTAPGPGGRRGYVAAVPAGGRITLVDVGAIALAIALGVGAWLFHPGQDAKGARDRPTTTAESD